MAWVCFLLSFLAAAAFGQFNLTNIRRDGDTMTVKLGEPRGYGGQAITGVPYSGERVSEHVQTLADGTHIAQPQNIEKIWRDSQGRMRQEEVLAGDGGEFIVAD